MTAASRLTTDPAPLGLERRTIGTTVGPVVVRAAPGGDAATLLLHGAAGSWTTWTPLLRHALETGVALPGVVALDLPGWGETRAPREPLSVETAARAVADVALALGHERWTVVGHSLGGFLALALAAAEPDRTTGVVLVSPTGPAVVEAVRRPVRGGVRLPWFAGMLLAMRALAAMPGGGAALLRVLGRAGAMPRLAAPLFHDPDGVDPSVSRALATEIRARAFVSAAEAATRYDLDDLRRIRCPVRSVRGARDVFAGGADAAALGRLLPDFHEDVLADAGHFAHVQRPDAVLAAIDAVRS